MGVRRKPPSDSEAQQKLRLCANHSAHSRRPHIADTDTLITLPALPSAAMDLYTLIPRTLVGVVYPAFMSLKSVLHGSPESARLAEVLGRPRSLLPRGAPPGPSHQPA